MLQPGDRMLIRFPGGGGFGNPRERDVRLIEKDLRHGVLSKALAKAVYGHES